MKRDRRARPAFSLVEMIATMTVIATLGAVSSGLVYTGVRAYSSAHIRSQIHEEASTALDRLCHELRRCPLDPSGPTGSPLISSVTPNSITWGGNFSLALSGSTLTLTENGLAAPLISSVSALSIQCYDESNAALATSLSGTGTQAIRRVSISLSLQRDGISDTVRTKIFLRSTIRGVVP